MTYLKTVQHILHTYHVKPLVIEDITDRLQRIDDGQQLYAFKRVQVTDQFVNRMNYAYQQAHDKQLRCMLPLYLTETNELFTYDNDNYYYLTPWIASDTSPLNHSLQTIGSLHQKTTETYVMNMKSFKDKWKDYQNHCQTNFETYLSYVAYFEKAHYMSPLGLQVCTHFDRIDSVFKILQDEIKQLLEESSDQIKSTYCLCHGQLKPSHIIGREDVFILNWEKSQPAHASLDLASYLKNHIIHENDPMAHYREAFTKYMKENKLKKQDLHLLTIHLLDPTEYMTIIKQTINSQNEQSMIKQVQKLQQHYRQLLFGLQWAQFIHDTYMIPELDDINKEN